MKRPTEEQIWKLAITADADRQLRRVLAMTDEEVRASLVERGYDLRVLDAEAEALWKQFHPRKVHGGYLASVSVGGFGVIGAIGMAVSSMLASPAATAPLQLMAAAAPPPAVTQEALDAGVQKLGAGRDQ